MTTLRLARNLLKSGCSVLPITGKRPRMKWKRLQSETLTPAELNYWFSDLRSTVGLITGRLSGFVVIDADDAEAVRIVRDYCPFTQMSRPTARGEHFFYRWPGYAVANSTGVMGQQIDIRGDGGYVVIKPNLTGFSREVPIFNPGWLG